MRSIPLILLLAIAFGTAGCGSSSDKGAKADTTTEEQAAEAAEAAAPPELAGDWRMTLRKTDLPPSPDVILADGVGTWLLAISNSDPDKRRSLTLWAPDPRTGKAATRNPRSLLDSPRLGVKGDLLLLHDVECGATNAPAPVLPAELVSVASPGPYRHLRAGYREVPGQSLAHTPHYEAVEEGGLGKRRARSELPPA